MNLSPLQVARTLSEDTCICTGMTVVPLYMVFWNKACPTNFSLLDEIIRRLGEGRPVDLCCLDFGKAFDLVSHRLLLRTSDMDAEVSKLFLK